MVNPIRPAGEDRAHPLKAGRRNALIGRIDRPMERERARKSGKLDGAMVGYASRGPTVGRTTRGSEKESKGPVVLVDGGHEVLNGRIPEGIDGEPSGRALDVDGRPTPTQVLLNPSGGSST
ncbi:hypothetical protein NPIL_3091 [Nephila pilipes]|uniref:Uncharacterized protein n=1 Tax=Nephila pilipes TaxID=299642 RepID=A0A8X6P1P2_NEPPI|nr:hypothetical protein NPIL_3091 [Nephila pilipes]